MAQQYRRAATTLYPLSRDLEAPLYFLYTHTIELALKAYLRSHGAPGPRIHDLRSLIQLCRKLGLRVTIDLNNVIELLESENSVHGFRYFAFTSTSKPEIGYVREVVDALMTTVVDEVRKRASDDHPNAVVGKLTVGKPRNR